MWKSSVEANLKPDVIHVQGVGRSQMEARGSFSVERNAFPSLKRSPVETVTGSPWLGRVCSQAERVLLQSRALSMAGDTHLRAVASLKVPVCWDADGGGVE